MREARVSLFQVGKRSMPLQRISQNMSEERRKWGVKKEEESN